MKNCVPEPSPCVADGAQMISDEHRVCEGCGGSWSEDQIKAGGYLSCCPERRMLSAKQWECRVRAWEEEVRTIFSEDAFQVFDRKVRARAYDLHAAAERSPASLSNTQGDGA